MKLNRKIISFGILIIGIIGIFAFTQIKSVENKNILSHTVDLTKQELKFYWKNKKGENIKNFQNLISLTKSHSKNLIFAMNGGMYKKDLSPQGIYIENGILKSEIDTLQKGYGNFYMQPNGIFYITNNNKGVICRTKEFKNENIKYATQSGPLLIIEGEMHSKFRNGSKNLNIRNGVGILPNGKLIFAMSTQKINFYDFATYFKNLGCKNALYLDGFVSKTYLPEKNWNEIDGNFGVIIAEIEVKE
jgi:uncharacterized protein YigE (DUF2233 family)